MPAEERWSTNGLPRGQRFDAFALALQRAHFEWDLDAPAPQDYQAGTRRRLYRDFRLTEVNVEPFGGDRSDALVRRSSADHVSLVYLLEGEEWIQQGRQECIIRSGDLTMWDATRPAQFRCTQRVHQLSLLLPKAMLANYVPGLEAACAIRLPGDTGVAKVLGAHMQLIHDQMDRVRAELQPGLIRATIELLATALNAETGEEGPANLRAGLLAQVKAYILDRITDPDLTPTAVARAFRISTRYLHRIFEDTGRTVGEWIRELRLERCRAALADPVQANLPVTEIAFKNGFSSVSHFSRAFRARYEMTPTAYRERRFREKGL